jgi:hypothetical protein
MKLIKKYWPILVGSFLILPSLWPIFRVDFFRTHDWLHVARIVELTVSLQAGLWPARWAPDFGWGYGMPLFHFYPPLPYYTGAILYLFKMPAVMVVKSLFALNYFAGFYFMYLLGKKIWGKWGGWLAAVSFSYLPYRSVQFYVRGSLAELTAMTLLPLFYYAAIQVVTVSKEKKKRFVLLTALSLAGIFLSHNVIALFSVFFLPLFLILFIKSWKQWLVVGLVGFGLSAFFTLPAFLEKNLTVVNQLAGGYSHYSLHFIYLRQLVSRFWDYGGSVLGPEDDISFQLGWPQIILALFALVAGWRSWHKKDWLKAKVIIYSFFSLAVAIFMMTFHSQLIWQKLTFLHIAQFPWRLLAFASTLVGFLAGGVVDVLPKKWQKLTTLTLIIVTIGLNVTYFRPEKFINTQTFYFTDRQLIKQKLGDVLPDYLPKTAQKPPTVRQGWFSGENLTIIDEVVSPGYGLVKVSTEKTTQLIFSQFYFPGWQATIDKTKIQVDKDPVWGLISLEISEGEHQVIINLRKTPIQQIADMITLTTIIGLAIYLIKLNVPKYFRI